LRTSMNSPCPGVVFFGSLLVSMKVSAMML
jgi:hypothetical protein